MSEFTIQYNAMPLFYNPLMRGGKTIKLDIKSPAFEGISLCSVTLSDNGASIHDFVRQKTYDTIRDSLADKLDKRQLINEVPEYNTLHEVLYQSGVLKPEGLDTLYDYINKASEQSVVKGGDVYYIAFDTNALRDRLYTNHLRQFSDWPNIDFVLSETVRFELTNRKDKIKRGTCSILAKLFKEAAFDLANQNILADRRRYEGFLEYNKIRHETDCDQLKPMKNYDNKDEEIIRTYADFATAGHNRKVLLISRDNEFIRMSPSLPGVIPISLSHPWVMRGAKPFNCAFSEFHSFLYHLSTLYGYIELWLMEHRLFKCWGVWSQKNASQWENDFIRISPNKELPFISDIERQLSVLEAMKYRQWHWRFPKTEI